MEQDLCMDQPWLLGAERFCIQTTALQVARTPVGEEHVGILQQLIALRAVLLGVV